MANPIQQGLKRAVKLLNLAGISAAMANPIQQGLKPSTAKRSLTHCVCRNG